MHKKTGAEKGQREGPEIRTSETGMWKERRVLTNSRYLGAGSRGTFEAQGGQRKF